MKIKQYLLELIVILYVSLLLYTAISKLSDYNLTREQMALMPLLKPVAHIMTWLLPLTEIIIAILLFIPKTRLTGIKAATALMLSFTIYVTYMLIFFKDLPCSCGGFLDSLSWPQHLVFNGIFILLGLLAMYLHKRKSWMMKKEILVVNS